MDAVILARIQFAFTIGFHYIFPPINIGLGWLITWIMWRAWRTRDPIYEQMGRFWIRIFALTFAVGVATGITMEFQFGTNWAAYSRYVGDIFGAPLAAEGLFAFFLESTFMGVLLFGGKRIGPRMHAVSALLVAVGATLSGFWIIVANSWQQTPAGFEIVGDRAVLTDFAAAVFNPSLLPRYTHTIVGALTTGAFFMLGLSAWYLLKGKHIEFAQRSFKIGLIAGLIGALGQLGTGHHHALQVAETQPAKFAAFEALFETTDNAPMLLFGLPNQEAGRNDFEIPVPSALSILAGGSPDTTVRGLNDFPRDEWPPVHAVAATFHTMFFLGAYFIGFTLVGAFLLWRKKLFGDGALAKWYQRFAVISLPLPIIANELGWMAAEVGRQPWAVWHLLRTEDAVSVTVPAWQLMISLAMFAVVYAVLFVLWVFLLRRKMRAGPGPVETTEEVAA